MPVKRFGVMRGCGSMVERGLPKPETRVRFPSPAPLIIKGLRRSASKVQVIFECFSTWLDAQLLDLKLASGQGPWVNCLVDEPTRPPHPFARTCIVMGKVDLTLRAHQELSLNWFRAKGEISSGAVEGLNNKCRVVTRRSNGFRTYNAMEIALYHNLGRLPEPESAHRFC